MPSFACLSTVSFLVNVRLSCGVLRFPDAGFDLRWPIEMKDCDSEFESHLATKPAGKYQQCLYQLREHVRDDLNCTAITSNNSYYVLDAELAFIYAACDHFRLAFECIFSIGMESTGSPDDLDSAFRSDWEDFVSLQLELFTKDTPVEEHWLIFANSTRAVVKHHTELIVKDVAMLYSEPQWRSILQVALAVATRMQFLIENLSMTLLVNWLLANLQQNSIIDGKDYVRELYGDVRNRYIFHDFLGPKRWHVLCYLLDRLSNDSRGAKGLRMAEIGVDTANVSTRLLETYPASTLELHVGVDPYQNKPGSAAGDAAYEATRGRLGAFGSRSRLLRMTSEQAAAELVDEAPFDLVFLDARHDFGAVTTDIISWWPKVRRPGGVLCGHDFQWQYPGLPMAVTAALRTVPVRGLPGAEHEGVVHLASDGMWWFDL